MKETHYTSKEVKDKLGITATTLMRWKNEGKIRITQLSQKKVWYLKEDVDKLIQ
jgi:predicted site-specific integrase-resolvase